MRIPQSNTLSAQNRTDGQWGLFITVHLALLGGIIYADRPLSTAEKFGALVVYFGFALTNYKMMLTIFHQVNDLYLGLLHLGNDPCCCNSAAVQRAVDESAAGRSERTHALFVGSHIIMAAVIALSIERCPK
ncbi:MAG: hypothetical protein ACI9JM_001843 [Halioglobus sp.]|jgi:hypothetical protein